MIFSAYGTLPEKLRGPDRYLCMTVMSSAEYDKCRICICGIPATENVTLQVQPVRCANKKNKESRDAGNPPDTHNWSARLLSTTGRPIPAAPVGEAS